MFIALWHSLLLLWLLSFSVTCEKYLLYDIFPGEGFNLRRDVYIRVANLVRALRQPVDDTDCNWILVLPPWGRLPHWETPFDPANSDSARWEEVAPTRPAAQPWSDFFDIASLRQLIPVIELSEFQALSKDSSRQVDLAIHLYRPQVLEYGRSKREVKFCDQPIRTLYQSNSSGDPRIPIFTDILLDGGLRSRQSDCITGDLEPEVLAPFLQQLTENCSVDAIPVKSVFLNSAESIIHGIWSEWSEEYWTVRRSMVFASHLRQAGDSFRAKWLNSTDEMDRTIQPKPIPALGNGSTWLRTTWPTAPALGGPYLGVHWRCGDYVSNSLHPWSMSPSPAVLAKQIRHTLDHVNMGRSVDNAVNMVFLATDGLESNVHELTELLRPIVSIRRFRPTRAQLDQWGPGGVAIVDQWICAHASFFVGTNPSTFTFRINEERTIMGFPYETTFNVFCPNANASVVLHHLDTRKDVSTLGCEGLTSWPVRVESAFAYPKNDLNGIHEEL